MATRSLDGSVPESIVDQHERAVPERMVYDPHRLSVDLTEGVIGEYLFSSPFCADRSSSNHHYSSGVVGSSVEVVQDGNNGVPRLSHLPEFCHDTLLVGNIECGRWLIEQHDEGRLRQNPGKRNPRLLA